jgi:hypothetical protein
LALWKDLWEALSDKARLSISVLTLVGHLSCWRGYKLHLDVADGGISITFFFAATSFLATGAV